MFFSARLCLKCFIYTGMLNFIRFCVRCCCKRDLHNLCFADEKGKFDEVVEDKGVRVLIDPKALMHVIGTEMDFVDNRLM
jgi:Fe-S cluster assembly iron-binding protein IscA